MNTSTTRRVTGLLLLLVPVLFTTCFTLLQMQFEYPDILRQPAESVLTKFTAGGPALLATWYLLTITALLFVPIAVLFHRILAREGGSTTLWLATTFGVLAGLVQTLGFVRWPFVVPQLATLYLEPGASEAQRVAVMVVFEAFNRYAGVAVGEHLGYLTTSVWTFLIALEMLRTRQFSGWLAYPGMLLAAGIFVGLFEMVGLPLAGAINAISYLAWSLWLIVVGIMLLAQRSQATVATTLVTT